jgi:hypothetical protein
LLRQIALGNEVNGRFMHTHSNKAVLFALAPASKEALYDAIPDDFKCYWCTSTAQVMKLMHKRLDLIVCCTMFDSSQMFELLRYCKSTAKLRITPVLCIRAVGGELDDAAFAGVAIACKALGAVGFFDFNRMAAQSGREIALKTANIILGDLCNNLAAPHSCEFDDSLH